LTRATKLINCHSVAQILTDHTLISLFTPHGKIVAMRLGRALQAADFKTKDDLGLEEFSPDARSLLPQYERLWQGLDQLQPVR
jgi:hypothetical protein